ncbi:MAG: aminoacyl-tRNA hydrolase [Clostridia bacterium]|nr:aminoacyl-tRNA hydrolase [Clostridia bacterium]
MELFFRKKENFSGVEYIVVGLGNPDRKYENTRHNAGFITVDTLADKMDIRLDRIKYKSLCNTCTIADKKVLLMKPSTYMNNSGQAVVEAMNFFKVPSENVIVIFDDISLDVGKMRIRRKGSDGGHNGIKNIIYLSGSDRFPRIKMGVGNKPEKWDLADWVLSNFTDSERKLLDETAQKACDAVEKIISGNIDKAMNLYNS